MRQPCKKMKRIFQISNFAPYVVHDALSFQLSDTMSTSLPAPRSECLAVCHHETSKNTTRKNVLEVSWLLLQFYREQNQFVIVLF